MIRTQGLEVHVFLPRMEMLEDVLTKFIKKMGSLWSTAENMYVETWVW